MDIAVVSNKESFIAKMYAFLQQAFTGVPYYEFLKSRAFRIRNRLYAPDGFATRMTNKPTQYDLGALVYEISRMLGKTREEADREEKRFLAIAKNHFASGPEPNTGDGVAESLFTQYVDKMYYLLKKEDGPERPFRA